MGMTLVAYFSASGVTAKPAKTIAETIGADLYEIVPEQIYTAEDLDWTKQDSRSTIEMKDASSRVAIKSPAVDMAQYDKVIIGYPVWWGVAPHIINTFLEAYDLTGKIVVPFATSGSSGIGDTAAYIGASAKGAKVENAKLVKASISVAEVEAWLK